MGSVHGVTQNISATYEVAAELCLLSQVIIYKPVPVDVASTLEVNLLRPGNSQATTTRDSPQSAFPTSL